MIKAAEILKDLRVRYRFRMIIASYYGIDDMYFYPSVETISDLMDDKEYESVEAFVKEYISVVRDTLILEEYFTDGDASELETILLTFLDMVKLPDESKVAIANNITMGSSIDTSLEEMVSNLVKLRSRLNVDRISNKRLDFIVSCHIDKDITTLDEDLRLNIYMVYFYMGDLIKDILL